MNESMPSPERGPQYHILQVTIDYFTAFTIEEYMQEKSIDKAQAMHDLVDLALAVHTAGEQGCDFETDYPFGEQDYQLPTEDLAARFKGGPKPIEVLLVERLHDAIQLIALENRMTQDQIVSYLIGLVRPLHVQRRKGAVVYKVPEDTNEWIEFPFR